MRRIVDDYERTAKMVERLRKREQNKNGKWQRTLPPHRSH
jgi:hypothetical protein